MRFPSRPSRASGLTTLLALLLLAPMGCGDGTGPGTNNDGDPDADVDEDGFTPNGGDCDDNDASVHVGATESCDGVDNDCDEAIDENADGDNDGYLDADACAGGQDCDDNNAEINPDGTEACDGLDNNCDGQIDELFDDDGDGEASETRCASGTDCDDSDPTVYSGAEELCDGIDNNCNGTADEDFDQDGDGFSACPGGEQDCNDSDPAIYPGALEILDEKDNDCADGPEEVDYDLAYADFALEPSSGFAFTLTNRSVEFVGDVNGDGCDDAMIGLPNEPGNPQGHRGLTYLVMGQSGDDTCNGAPLDNDQYLFSGVEGGEEAGKGIAHGDFNGDGLSDVAISAPRRPLGFAPNYGIVYILFGKSSGWSDGLSLANADVQIYGTYPGEEFGTDIASVGDINGDNFDDLVIGAQSSLATTSRQGRAYLMLGRSTGWSNLANGADLDSSWIGESQNSQTGAYVGGVGDINGDKLNDFLIGAPLTNDGGANSGKTYLIYGKNGTYGKEVNLASADAKFIGSANDGAISVGDVTRSPSAKGIGDVDGDGLQDFVITAPASGGASQSEVNVGKAYLVYGRSNKWVGSHALTDASGAVFYGENSGDQFGTDVGPLGDVNGDNISDFYISAPDSTDGSSGSSTGYTYVLLGREDRTPWSSDGLFYHDVSFLGGQSGKTATGEALAGEGDFNGDGYQDFGVASSDGSLFVVTDFAY